MMLVFAIGFDRSGKCLTANATVVSLDACSAAVTSEWGAGKGASGGVVLVSKGSGACVSSSD